MKLRLPKISLILNVGLLIGVLFLFSVNSYANQDRLSDIRNEIENHQKLLQQKKHDYNELQNQLNKDEREYKEISSKLKKSQVELDKVKNKIKEIEIQQNELIKEKKAQLQLLKVQITEAYKLGYNDYIMLILNQQNPNEIGRILEYYRYISIKRLDIVKKVDELNIQIGKIHETLIKNNNELKNVVKLHEKNVHNHQIKQKMKEETLLAMKESMRNEEKTLSELKKQEKKIHDDIARNQKILEEKKKKREQEEITKAKQLEVNKGKTQEQIEDEIKQHDALPDFESKKGQLLWPAHGKVIKKFGQSRAGELKWNGMLIHSRNGQVKSIAEGDVVLETELSGYGYIIVIDHGNGYVSLYGNNKDNLKKFGDHVKEGELIAYTNTDSYQLDGSLYFEIRHKGEAINPAKWLKKK